MGVKELENKGVCESSVREFFPRESMVAQFPKC